MNELGLNASNALSWFPNESEEPYTLIRVNAEHAADWEDALCDAVRRCYLSDETLETQAHNLEEELGGSADSRRAEIIASKLPDAGSTMAGDFGEILIYCYQAATALPRIAFGPKKWRLKQDRTKPAPGSDLVHFILPTWPTASDQDEILCAEVKTKSTNGDTSPIAGAIDDCAKDRTSRLSKTLQWLKERALTERLGEVQISHLDRFISAIEHPTATKSFRAVAVICEDLVDLELALAPQEVSPEFQLVVVAVPNLHAVYNAVFAAAKASSPPSSPL